MSSRIARDLRSLPNVVTLSRMVLLWLAVVLYLYDAVLPGLILGLSPLFYVPEWPLPSLGALRRLCGPSHRGPRYYDKLYQRMGVYPSVYFWIRSSNLQQGLNGNATNFGRDPFSPHLFAYGVG